MLDVSVENIRSDIIRALTKRREEFEKHNISSEDSEGDYDLYRHSPFFSEAQVEYVVSKIFPQWSQSDLITVSTNFLIEYCKSTSISASSLAQGQALSRIFKEAFDFNGKKVEVELVIEFHIPHCFEVGGSQLKNITIALYVSD